MRLIWIGRDLFATALEAAIDAGHEVIAIQTSHGPGPTLSERLHQTAARQGIPISVGPVGPAEVAAMAAHAPDCVIVGGWPHKLPVPGDFGLRGLNLHPSLLPEGRGPWPLPHVILKGLSRTGVTLHQIAAEFDAGPIVAQRSFAVPPWFDLETLVHISRKAAVRLVVDTLADLDAAWAGAQPQVGGSWWPRPTRADRTLDWSAPAEDVFRIARAFGRDGVFGRIDGAEVRLIGLDLAPGDGPPGTVLERDGARIRVATGGGAVDLLQAPP